MHVHSSIQLLLFLVLRCSASSSQSQSADELRKPPELDRSLVNKVYEKILGDSVSLPCPVYSKRGLYFEWSSNGHTIDDIYSSSRFKVDDETGILKIKKLKLSDSGVYVCYAINGFGFVAGYVELHVMTLEGKRMKDGIHENKLPAKSTALVRKNSKIRNSFKPIPIHPRVEEDVFAFTGSDVSFVFTARGLPQPKFWWYMKSHPLSHKVPAGQFKEETEEVDSETMKTTLTLYNVTSKLSGRYSVRALNEKGLTEAVFLLNVYPIFKSEIIGEYPSNVSVSRGAELKLSCRMRAHVEPKIQWIKRSEPLFVHRSTDEYILPPCSSSSSSSSSSVSSSTFNSVSPSGGMVVSSSSGRESTSSAMARFTGNEVSSIISSNTITLRPKSVSLSPLKPPGTSCTGVPRRRASSDRRSTRQTVMSVSSTLRYIGDNIYENFLTIDKFNSSHTGYYVCFSYTSNEYRQIRVDMSPEVPIEASVDSVILLRESSTSYSTVTSLTHGNFIAFHAIFWLVGSVIFLCCMASILFMLSVRKSLQPSSGNSMHLSSASSLRKRNHLSPISTKFCESTGTVHSYKDVSIQLDPLTVPHSVASPHARHSRSRLTQVVVESHLPPKTIKRNSLVNQCICSRHRSPDLVDSKLLSTLSPPRPGAQKSNIYTVNENCDEWVMRSKGEAVDHCVKCSLCNQSIASRATGRSVPHLSDYYSSEKVNRPSYHSPSGGRYDSDEITVIN